MVRLYYRIMKNIKHSEKSAGDMATVTIAGAKAARELAAGAMMTLSTASSVARESVLSQYAIAVEYYGVPVGYVSEWLYGWRHAAAVLK